MDEADFEWDEAENIENKKVYLKPAGPMKKTIPDVTPQAILQRLMMDEKERKIIREVEKLLNEE